MDRGLSTGTHNDNEGLRERPVASQSASTLSPEALTATGDVEPKDTGKELKTYGRTPDGTGKSLLRTSINLLGRAILSPLRRLAGVLTYTQC